MDAKRKQLEEGRQLSVWHETTAMGFKSDGVSPMAEYWAAVWKRIWLIVLFTGVGVCGAYAISTRLTPLYEAGATIEFDRENPLGIVGEQQAAGSYAAD